MVLRRRSPAGPAVTASRTRRAPDPVRDRLARALAWDNAHVSFDDAVKGLAPRLRGQRPRGAAHSVWELVDHIRRAQHDILDYCRNPSYTPHTWPDDYWPPDPAPSSVAEWNAALDAIRRDRRALQRIARDRSRGLEIDRVASVGGLIGVALRRQKLLPAAAPAFPPELQFVPAQPLF